MPKLKDEVFKDVSADEVRSAWILGIRDMLASSLKNEIKYPLTEPCPPIRASKKRLKEYEDNRLRHKLANGLIREATSSLEKAAILLGAVSLNDTAREIIERMNDNTS